MKINKITVLLFLAIVLIAGGIMSISCSTFGEAPKGIHLSRIEKSPQYDKEKGKFVNRRPGLVEENLKKNISWSNIKEWFRAREDTVPEEKLPAIKPELDKFIEKSENVKFIWFGHSSILLNISGKKILIDPVFSGAASPVSFMVKRFQKPVLELYELPEIDYIVISHDHYDHLDMNTVKFFKNKKAEFIVPLGVGSHLEKWGIESVRITELDWWEKNEKGNIEFIAAPAQHFSGRSLTKRDKTLWASWIIKNKNKNIFFSGDSGYDIHFKEIGKKYGPFDLAFIETGQYNEKWKEVHMLPRESAQAYFDLRAKRYCPIHWGMFELSLHPWYQPAIDITKEAESRGINLVTPKLGEIITLEKNLKTARWWKPLLKNAESKKEKAGLVLLEQEK